MQAGSTGLRPLLRKLISSPEFCVDRRPLTLSDGTRTTIAEGCQYVEVYHPTDATSIVWGKIKTTKADWINSGFRDEKLSAVRMRKDAIPNILKAADVQSVGDLVGWYFLVEGQFGETSAGGPYASLRDANRIAFLLTPLCRLAECYAQDILLKGVPEREDDVHPNDVGPGERGGGEDAERAEPKLLCTRCAFL
ncbi:hypothetical protein C5E05_13975 [Pseudoclavibacter sp. AY1H1]|nr:hypothetical protein C5E05_13975 [Pseudoclavibacter sp. AY1H1]